MVLMRVVFRSRYALVDDTDLSMSIFKRLIESSDLPFSLWYLTNR